MEDPLILSPENARGIERVMADPNSGPKVEPKILPERWGSVCQSAEDVIFIPETDGCRQQREFRDRHLLNGAVAASVIRWHPVSEEPSRSPLLVAWKVGDSSGTDMGYHLTRKGVLHWSDDNEHSIPGVTHWAKMPDYPHPA